MKKRQQIIDYVNGQTGIDLGQFRSDFAKRFERKNVIIIEYQEMKKSQWRYVENLAGLPNARIRIEPVGAWGKMIAWINQR